mmetsp:Transcript_15232/g.47346  ORF Transcript_15232/g.47346 Transcript_15232/m.47346 type:complete len:136 (-) Transcript_15232:73-480(-)
MSQEELAAVARYLQKTVEENLTEMYVSAVEMGVEEGNLHRQNYMRTKIPPATLSKRLKEATFAESVPGRVKHVMTKLLTGKTLHTHLGMIGYCTKDIGLDHYKLDSHGVTPAEVRRASVKFLSWLTITGWTMADC